MPRDVVSLQIEKKKEGHVQEMYQKEGQERGKKTAAGGETGAAELREIQKLASLKNS